jgi:IMP cyclohydrolase
MDGLARLADGTYRGRGLALGPAPDGKSAVIVYWVTGRSERSRNRRLVESPDGIVRTEFVDAGRGDDPALVVYPLLMSRGGTHVVSNGEQTQPILDALCAGRTLEQALKPWSAEPDELATPRITGTVRVDAPDACRLGVVRERAVDGQAVTERSVFAYEGLPPGSGRCVTTYAGGPGDPAPFAGDPLCVRFEADPEATCARFREALAGPMLVSVIVRFAGRGGPLTAIANLQG